MHRAAGHILSATSGTANAPAGTDTPRSLAESIVDIKVSALQVEACASVVKAADDTLGTLLDVIA